MADSSNEMPPPAPKMELTLKRRSPSKTVTPGPQTAKDKGKASAIPKAAPRKRKAPADKAAQARDDGEENGSKDDTSTPKRKKAKASTKNTDTTPDSNDDDHDVRSMPIPNSYEDCGEADKMLFDKASASAKPSWAEIRKAWTKITKQRKLGISTLPNRFARLKANFVVIKEDDNGRLITAKQAIDKAHEERKWGLIAKKVVELGGEVYEGEALRQRYKKLMGEMGVLPPDDVDASDFRD